MRKSNPRMSAGRLNSFAQSEHIFEFNVKAVSEELDTITQTMMISPQRAIKNMQSVFARHQRNLETMRHWMNHWVDKRGLDLLQCAIISNKPSIIHFLIDGARLFPPTHFPKLNPYAHMAATVGLKDALEAVLRLRPGDYFAGSQPSHAVRLPQEVMTFLKLCPVTGMANRRLDKIVQSVKRQSVMVESTMKKAVADSKQNFQNEVKSFEDSLRSTKEKPRRFNPYLNGSSSLPRASPQSWARASGVSRTDKKQRVLIPKPRKCKIQSKVTVHRDVLFTEDIAENADLTTNLFSTPGERTVQFSPDLIASNSKPDQYLTQTDSRNRFNLTGGKKRGFRSSNPQLSTFLNKPELGVRKFKKYKEFTPVFEHRALTIDDPRKYMHKTPLTLAAEKNHFDCVNYLLQRFHSKKVCGGVGQSDPLTLATNARIPEAIAILLQRSVSLSDYQNAVLLAIRELYPDSLNVLLALGDKVRHQSFSGENLFHILYSQSLHANYRYEMLPEMTRVLINNSENVNFQKGPRNYPMYTLIRCAFNVEVGEQSLYFLKCLKMLLQARANPHYDETRCLLSKKGIQPDTHKFLLRPAFSSAIHCVLDSANDSFHRFEVRYWSQIIMQKFIETIESQDRTPRQIHGEALFLYMRYVSNLGLNKRVLRALLRSGADPNVQMDGKFALNVFFEEMIFFLTKFQVNRSAHASMDNTVNTLLFLCRAMNQKCLHECVVQFLDRHLLSMPLQALEMSKRFCYHANKMINSPRTLSHTTSLFVWMSCGRNPKNVRQLSVPDEIIQAILP